MNFKKNHYGKPCDVWEFILAFGDKKSLNTGIFRSSANKEEIYDTYQNYGYEQGIKVKEDELQEIIWNGESDIAKKNTRKQNDKRKSTEKNIYYRQQLILGITQWYVILSNKEQISINM